MLDKAMGREKKVWRVRTVWSIGDGGRERREAQHMVCHRAIARLGD